jgi:hypothetical protein
MNDLHTATDEELGRALTALAGDLAWPITPDMAPRVVATVREEQAVPSLVAPRLSLPSRRRTLLLVVAAILALAGVALAARLVFHLGAIGLEVVDGPATSLPSNTLNEDQLGREVSFEQATRMAGFAPTSPDALGPPDRVWVDETEIEIDFESGDVATRTISAWEPTQELPAIEGTDTGALLMQFEGEWEVAAKQVYAETDRYGEAVVEGRPAFWTTGPHTLTLVSGRESHRVLVTGTVVIWQDAGFTFRLETGLPRAQAIAIAETVTASIGLG